MEQERELQKIIRTINYHLGFFRKILHGDGSNVVAKKGVPELDTLDINTKKVKKS
jgi:hypothetical protein